MREGVAILFCGTCIGILVNVGFLCALAFGPHVHVILKVLENKC